VFGLLLEALTGFTFRILSGIRKLNFKTDNLFIITYKQCKFRDTLSIEVKCKTVSVSDTAKIL